MTKIKFLICILFLVNYSFSQGNTITGIVTSDGNPLPGALVLIVGTQKGTQADESGKFSLKAKINDTLVISFLGKIDYKFKVENYNSISVVLKDGPQQIKEAFWHGHKINRRKIIKPLVVIDGVAMDKNYDAQKELDRISSDEITETIYLPNPIYIINGVEYSEESLFGENPTSPYAPLDKQNITSTDILKPVDAMRIYGQKGEKGVVIITTKDRKPVDK